MKYRPLTELDAEAYRSIRFEALQTAPEAFASSYEEEKELPVDAFKARLKGEDSVTFGMFYGESLVGVTTLLIETKQKLRHRAMLVVMYVSPQKRGEGVGKALIKQAVQKAEANRGIEQIYLTVVSTNESAKKLYQSMGFKRYGVDKQALKLDNNVYLDEDLMVLDIKERIG